MSKTVGYLTYDQTRDRLLNRVLVFNGDIRKDADNDFFPGQKTRVIEVTDESSDDTPDGTCYGVITDFTEFEEHNNIFSKPVYYDDHGQTRLHFHETSSYPADKRITVFIGGLPEQWPFEVSKDGKIGPVVLTRAEWNAIVEKFGQHSLDEIGVKER